MRNPYSKPISILLLLTAVVLLTYSGFELYTYVNSPEHHSPDELIEQSLDVSEQVFDQINQEFTDQTLQLWRHVRSRLKENTSRQTLYGELQDFPFWGSSLQRNGEFFTWDGFTFPSPPGPKVTQEDSLHLSIIRRNNVIFLSGQISFTIGSDHFLLSTSRRLQQNNVIPIAEEQEYDLSGHPALEDLYPVYFSFSDPPPLSIRHYRELKTAQTDSAGIVYADPSELEDFISSSKSQTSRWRTLFHILLFILGTTLLFYWSYVVRSWISLLFQLAIILLAWIIFVHSDIPVQWIPLFVSDLGSEQLLSLRAISYYAIHSVFTFLTAFAVITTLTRKWNLSSPEQHYQTFLYASLFGMANMVVILFFLITTYKTATVATLNLLDLELIPDLANWILFISTGFFLSSIAALLIASWWYLFITEKDKTAVVCLIAAISFFLFYFLADQVLETSLFEPWKFLLSFGLFTIFIGSAVFIYRFPESFLQFSGFRFLLMASFLTSAAGYTIYVNAHLERMDDQLMSTALDFSAEEDDIARNVTYDLLSNIERNLRYLSVSEMTENSSAVQSQFQRAIQNSIQEEWRRYSYDIQLLDSEGTMISDYATNFDSPGSGYLDLIRMEIAYRQEQIRRETNRPVVQNKPTSLHNSEFMVYHRGWIPIYDNMDPTRIIAWIVAVVYIERPDFHKPIRAVLTASTVEDWRTSYHLAKYRDSLLINSTMRGIYANQPKYNRLSDQEIEIAETDSVAFISNFTAQGTFRELIFRDTDNTIVKASTPLPRFNNHLFSFFRINVIVLFAGFILFPLFSFLGLKTFSLFRQSRRFQSRLLDGLVMATLLFLVVLIVATQQAVRHQNQSNLQRDIITKLDNLADSMRLGQQSMSDQGFIPLNRAATPLNADAIFYRNQEVMESTTPQIFQQNLLPRILPYPIYDFLYNRQRNHVVRTLDIGNETLLVGYRAIHAEDTSDPLGIIAIPTFLQSPLYTEQLLETTSYLLGIYLLIFTVFIIGTVFISNRLTRPLQYIQEGLNKISGGDLETTIPVKSKDEIGALSNAYNIMVEQLKQLQIDLGIAEREAAWKEMAQQVAHEIKNPLTPMKLNLQHLKRQLENEAENPERFKHNVERVTMNIIEQIESLNKIASDFSKFAHPVREEFSEVDMNELIRSVVELYEPETHGKIFHQLHFEPLYVLGAEDELRRSLINLVKNSYEAVETDARLQIRSGKKEKQAVIEIEDNGSGIPEELRDKIFTPNFSTKSSGTGLGLAITKKIIEAHHGTISFQSDVETGTKFRIELPLASNGKAGE